MGVPSRDHPLAPKGGSGVGHPCPQPAPTPLGPPGGGGSVRHVRRLAGPRRPKEAVKRETDCRVQGDPGHPRDAGHVARAQHGNPAARGGPGLGIANPRGMPDPRSPRSSSLGPHVPGDRGAAQRAGAPDPARPALDPTQRRRIPGRILGDKWGVLLSPVDQGPAGPGWAAGLYRKWPLTVEFPRRKTRKTPRFRSRRAPLFDRLR